MRTTEQLDRGWCFHPGDGSGYEKTDFDDSGWQKIRVPHDWDVGMSLREDAESGSGGGYAAGGIGWYRLSFAMPEEASLTRNYLYFEGVYMDATFWLNGVKIGWHGYGYTSFRLDCGGAWRPGRNVLAVRVDNSHMPNSRWYSGSGIFRTVWLIRTGDVAIDLFGVRCAANGIYPEEDAADLQIQAGIRNDSDRPVHAGIQYRLLDSDGKEAMSAGTNLFLAAHSCSDTLVRPAVQHPHLWTVDDPYLYTLESTVTVEGAAVDQMTCRVGIRTAVFDRDRGFLLNGIPVKIKGMCVHHDCGLTGAVGFRESWKRRLQKLKEMGCNGIRCAHNPPEPVLLDLCDEMGFLVMDEIFDEWKLTKNKINNYYSQRAAYGSSLFFDQYAEEELISMLRRDYNHPSVIVWSIGNEIPEQSAADGVKILRWLQDICHREDATRMVTSACDNISAPAPIRTHRAFENALDVTGYNYVGRWGLRAENFYEEDRSLFPDRCFLGTENPSAGGRRGDYGSEEGDFFDYRTATMHYEALWRYEKTHDFVAGDYLWTGIDDLGEAEWPSRGAGSGPLDTAGFEKDTWYFFRSIWNEKAVTLHLLPHWNRRGHEGEFCEVICYTNCDAVKLYLNGRYVGLRAARCPRFGASRAWNDRPRYAPTTNDLHLAWDVPYEPGELRAEGYIGEKLAAVEVLRTTGPCAALCASTDVTELGTEAQTDSSICPSPVLPHIAQIEVSAVDADGNEVPDASPRVRCTVSGPAHLIGMDAGDLLDHTLYGSPERNMMAGKLLAAVMADAPGEAVVTFHDMDEKAADAEIRLTILSQ